MNDASSLEEIIKSGMFLFFNLLYDLNCYFRNSDEHESLINISMILREILK